MQAKSLQYSRSTMTWKEGNLSDVLNLLIITGATSTISSSYIINFSLVNEMFVIFCLHRNILSQKQHSKQNFISSLGLRYRGLNICAATEDASYDDISVLPSKHVSLRCWCKRKIVWTKQGWDKIFLQFVAGWTSGYFFLDFQKYTPVIYRSRFLNHQSWTGSWQQLFEPINEE